MFGVVFNSEYPPRSVCTCHCFSKMRWLSFCSQFLRKNILFMWSNVIFLSQNLLEWNANPYFLGECARSKENMLNSKRKKYVALFLKYTNVLHIVLQNMLRKMYHDSADFEYTIEKEILKYNVWKLNVYPHVIENFIQYICYMKYQFNWVFKYTILKKYLNWYFL